VSSCTQCDSVKGRIAATTKLDQTALWITLKNGPAG
jgi:hypothetical protein